MTWYEKMALIYEALSAGCDRWHYDNEDEILIAYKEGDTRQEHFWTSKWIYDERTDRYHKEDGSFDVWTNSYEDGTTWMPHRIRTFNNKDWA